LTASFTVSSTMPICAWISAPISTRVGRDLHTCTSTARGAKARELDTATLPRANRSDIHHFSRALSYPRSRVAHTRVAWVSNTIVKRVEQHERSDNK
jgi:hypothetical protein